MRSVAIGSGLGIDARWPDLAYRISDVLGIRPQTAFYATWLRFGDEKVATEFLDAYPQHRLEGRLVNTEARREVLAVQVQDRLSRGDFNLSQIGDERQRENLARGYVKAAEALRGFSSELKLLERARELAPQWQEQL